MSEDKPQWGEWQEHDGGECPIDKGLSPENWQYKVGFLEGEIYPCATPERYDWTRDIIAYRVRES